MLNMKRWTALLLVITLLSGILSFAAVAEDADMQPANDKAVTRTQCNVREDRDVDSTKLRNLEWGKKLTVIGYFDDGWCKVIYNDSGDTGYVKESWLYVTRSEESISAVKAEAKDAKKEETAEPENQKETASAEDEEESSADTEEALAERDDPREEEAEDEDTGFPDELETDPSVDSAATEGSIVKADTSNSEEETDLVAVQAEDRAIVNTPSNVREAHDLESKKIHSMSKGTEVTIVEYYNDGWCKIEYSKEHYGYGRISWFTIPGKDPDDIPKDVTPSVDADPGIPVWDTEGRGSETPKFTEEELENTEISGAESMDRRDAPHEPEGIRRSGRGSGGNRGLPERSEKVYGAGCENPEGCDPGGSARNR